MEFLNIADLNEDLTILFRISLAAILAFIPGVERELTGKFAGLRTHILVCVGACIFTILSIYGFKMHIIPGVVGVNDPARIAAQVITGIGFIGAGTVMRHGTSVFGITTAATLWVCAAIGMSCGCGQYGTAVISAFVTLIVLIAIGRLEKTVLSKRKIFYTWYEITLSAKASECDAVQNIFQSKFHKVFKINKKIVNHEDLSFSGVVSSKKSIKEISEIFKNLDNISSIEIREYHD